MGANVVVTSPEHGIHRQMASNSAGEYNESALPAGSYDVIVTAPGFKKFQAKGVMRSSRTCFICAIRGETARLCRSTR